MQMNRYTITRLFIILALTISTTNISASSKQIAFAATVDKGPGLVLLKKVYTEVFKRNGLLFTCKQYPAIRASYMANSGYSDGVLSRIYSYNTSFPNLIRIEEPHLNGGFIAVGKSSLIDHNGWNSLAKTSYKVSYIRGVVGCEVNLPKVVTPENLIIVNNISEGYKMLLRGAVDIFIGPELPIIRTLHSNEYNRSGLRIIGIMQKYTSHAFLHKKHKELAPKISDTLKEIKEEGLIEKYMHEAGVIKYIKTK